VRSFKTTKRLLLAALAIGIAAYFGGSATMATFSAETTNGGSTTASGTLTMSDQVNSGTVCASYNSTSADNTNSGCSAILSLQNLGPGTFAGSGKVTIANTGSIDARSLYLLAPYANTTLNSPARRSHRAPRPPPRPRSR
jgi:hypothetical protein